MDAKKVPTLEEWIMESFPGANLDNLQISARVVVQIAQSYADFQAASLRSRNSELVEKRAGTWRTRAQILEDSDPRIKNLGTQGMIDTMRRLADELESLLTP